MINQTALFVFLLMVGIFMVLVGLIGFFISADFFDLINLISGLVIVGASIYRLIKPAKVIKASKKK